MTADEMVSALKLELPEVPRPIGSYVTLVEMDHWLFLSGLLPRRGSELVYRGKVGSDVTLEQACEAGRLCALNALSVLRGHYGTLNRILKLVRLVGFVQSHPLFYEQPRVLNGASDLFKEVFGEAGLHARTAVGVASLPANAVCEIELTLRVQ